MFHNVVASANIAISPLADFTPSPNTRNASDAFLDGKLESFGLRGADLKHPVLASTTLFEIVTV